MNKKLYNRYPVIDIEDEISNSQAVGGFKAIRSLLISEKMAECKVVTVDCYPGVNEDELLEGLVGIGFDKIIHSKNCTVGTDIMDEMLKDVLTADRVFGNMLLGNRLKLEDFFVKSRISKNQREIKDCIGRNERVRFS